MVPDMLIISTRVWAKLSVEHQKILKEAVDESVTEQRKLWITAVKKAMDVVKADGVTIIYPDKEPFRQSVIPMWDQHKDLLGDLAKRIREVK
jgi:TRAP-type C4-dicarboxylate transport system substrate-binding protein